MVAYVYDERDRLAERRYYQSAADFAAGAVAETVRYEYDTTGADERPDRVTETRGSQARVTDYLYDGRGRLIRVNTPEGVIDYGYDEATGRRTRMSTVAQELYYDYDAAGRLAAVRVLRLNGQDLSADPIRVEYTYDASGSLTRQVRRRTSQASGVTTDYTYDALDRVTDITHKMPDGTVLSHYHYTLNADGDRARIDETRRLADGSTAAFVTEYDYDALDRLIEEHYDAPGTADDYTTLYTYDRVGNRLARETTRGADVEREEYAYNALDQLIERVELLNGIERARTAYTYDRGGSALSETTTSADPSLASSLTYSYDVRGRLASASVDRYEGGQRVRATAEYRYTLEDLRAGVRTTTQLDEDPAAVEDRAFVVDLYNPTGFGQVVEEWLAGAAVPEVSYLYGLGPAGRAEGSAVEYLLGDALGSTRVVADESGVVVAVRYDYDAYGNVLGPGLGVTAPGQSGVLYTGERFDPVLRQMYLRARTYDPVTGRFTGMDPFAGLPNFPQSFHEYAYVHGNPVNGTDPSGMFEGLTGLLTTLGTRASMYAQRASKGIKVSDKGLRLYVMTMMHFNLAYTTIADSSLTTRALAVAASPYNRRLIDMVRKSKANFLADKDRILTLLRAYPNNPEEL